MNYFKWFDPEFDDYSAWSDWVYLHSEHDWVIREISEKGYAKSVLCKNCIMLEVYYGSKD